MTIKGSELKKIQLANISIKEQEIRRYILDNWEEKARKSASLGKGYAVLFPPHVMSKALQIEIKAMFSKLEIIAEYCRFKLFLFWSKEDASLLEFEDVLEMTIQ